MLQVVLDLVLTWERLYHNQCLKATMADCCRIVTDFNVACRWLYSGYNGREKVVDKSC